MDLNRYKNCYIEIYKITNKECETSGSIQKTKEEVNLLKNSLNMDVKKVIVWQHRLKDLYKDNDKHYVYMHIPITSIIENGYLINIYKRKVMHIDTFPILKEYYSEKVMEIYYNDNYEYNIINTNGILTYNFTFLNKGQIKDYTDYI